MTSKKVVAISGSHGFIGTRLCEVLSASGYEVYPIFRKDLELADRLLGLEPSYIIHLAAYGNHHNQTDMAEMLESNVGLTTKLLYWANDIKYSAFINVSTSSVYGIQNRPLVEGCPLCGKTPYALTKLAGENIAKAYASQGKPVVNVRPFSIYGPGEREDRFIPSLISHLKNGKKIKPMILDPNPVHDWTYIDDFIDGLIVVMKNADKLRGRAVNIGYGEQHTNEQVLDKVEWITGLDVVHEKSTDKRLPYDTTQMWQSDCTLLRSFGWTPKYNLMEGLRKTIPYEFQVRKNRGKEQRP